MSNSKHTLGPWYVGTEFTDQGRHIYASQKVCNEEGEEWNPLIACTDDDERLIDWQANAVLIAAAPDLLEALEDLREAIKSRGVVSTVKALSKADAAITKAKNLNVS
jgi:hypothetical protein